MDAVRREELDVRIVDERDAIQIHDLEVRRVRADLGDVDHFVDLLFRIIAHLESTCGTRDT